MSIFNSYSLINSIKSYNYTNSYNVFKQLTSLNYICTSFSGYIVVDYGLSKIFKFNKKFTFASSYHSQSLSQTKFILSVNNSNTIEIFVSALNGVYKFNISFSSIGYYYRYRNEYNGLFYKQTGDYILACSNTYYLY